MDSCRHKKCSQLITEDISSKINQSCDGIFRVIWKAVEVKPSGTVKIQNTSECFMIVIIKRSNDQNPIFAIIPPKSEKVFTVSCFISIQIACLGCARDKKCTGCLGLLLHYPLKTCNKKHELGCGQYIKEIRNE